MKFLSVAIIIVFTTISLSAKEFPGFYVNMEGDTIACKFDVRVNLFRKDLLNQLSFRKKIKIITEEGVIKYKPSQIKMFQIDSTSEGSEKYVPKEVEGKTWFVRVVEEGKINLYQYFYPHGYDGSVQMRFVLEKANKKPRSIPSAFWKKKVLKYLDNDKWFMDELNEEGLKYKNIPELIINYNLE